MSLARGSGIYELHPGPTYIIVAVLTVRSIMMKLVLHSYSFRHYPLEHVFVAAQRFGWSAIELSALHFDIARAPSDIAAAAHMAQRYGVQIYCAGYYADFLTEDESAQNQAICSVMRIIDACADNGIEFINGSGGLLGNVNSSWRQCGSRLAQGKHYVRAADVYRRLSDYADERGVRIAIEVHPGTIHDTVATAMRLLNLVGSSSVSITPDPGNSFLLSEEDKDPAILDSLKGRFSYFHLKNCIPRDGKVDFNVDTAHGVIDNYKWLVKLADLNIPAICVEYCGDGDPHPVIAAAPEYIRSSLEFAAYA
jgi:3-dehydroshikimate dehydratase